MELRNLSFLLALSWWRQSLQTAASFWPYFFLPAVCLGAANIVTVVGAVELYRPLHGPELEIEVLQRALAIGSVCMIVALVLTFWSLGLWLIRLTAFARALMQSSYNPDKEIFNSCLQDVRKHKMYLTKVWLVASALLLGPVILLAILLTVKVLASPTYPGRELIGLVFPAWLEPVCLVCMALLFVAGMAYTFVVFVMSARAESRAGETAWQSVCLFGRKWLGLSVVTVIVLVINALVSAPQTLTGAFSLEDALLRDPAPYIVLQIWFALVALVLWPWSLIPICKLLEGEKN